MHDTNLLEDQPIAWTPTPDVIERAQLTQFMKQVGVSTWVGYSANVGHGLTLAILDSAYAEPGTEVTFVWGEPDGGTSKPTVERHVQTEIRAEVAPAPIVQEVREAGAAVAATAQRCQRRHRFPSVPAPDG